MLQTYSKKVVSWVIAELFNCSIAELVNWLIALLFNWLIV